MDKCKEKFETLEDYQTSIRVFNERTRLDYEDFIHKQGQERQKLQLRFTPYTTKKGGYGVADLDHGLQTWQEQQKRIDELQARMDAFKVQSEKLRECSKSCVYNEREKKILLSQADDIYQILGIEQALKGEEND